MSWTNWWGYKEKDKLLDMSLEDYLAKYPTLEKHGIKIEEIENHASAVIDIDGHKMLVYKGNITKLHIDAIQNAANSSLMGGGGIDGAIHSGAGYSLHDECSKLGGCPTGESKITKGYNLPSATIIHTVGPIYSSYSPGKCSHQLQSCYKTTLELCDKYKLKSVGLCCVSCGIYGYPLEKATHIAFDTVMNYIKENKETSLEYIIFVVFLPHELEVYKQIFEKYNTGKYEKPILPPVETAELIAKKKKMEEIEKLGERIIRTENELKELKEKRDKLLSELKQDNEKDKDKNKEENKTEKQKVKEENNKTGDKVEEVKGEEGEKGEENNKTEGDKVEEENKAEGDKGKEENKTGDKVEEVKGEEGEKGKEVKVKGEEKENNKTEGDKGKDIKTETEENRTEGKGKEENKTE